MSAAEAPTLVLSLICWTTSALGRSQADRNSVDIWWVWVQQYEDSFIRPATSLNVMNALHRKRVFLVLRFSASHRPPNLHVKVQLPGPSALDKTHIRPKTSLAKRPGLSGIGDSHPSGSNTSVTTSILDGYGPATRHLFHPTTTAFWKASCDFLNGHFLSPGLRPGLKKSPPWDLPRFLWGNSVM